MTLLRAPGLEGGAPRFRHTFHIAEGHGALVAAVLEVTAEGLVEPRIDGILATRAVLVPGWTSYEWRLRVMTSDVVELLGPPGSTHEITLLAGNGWYCGRLGWMGAHGVYGPVPGVAARLRMTFADGTVQRIDTDRSWGVEASEVLTDDLYDGQTVDRHRGLVAVPIPLVDERLVCEQLDPARLVHDAAPPIVRHESLPPVSDTPVAGGTLFDFGQNLVGWLRLRVRGPAGHRLVVHHAEVLVEGVLARRPLRSARAEDVFVLSGGDDVFEPTLTFHGFRYAHIEGWDRVSGEVEAVVVGSELHRTGTFACADPVLNRFHENVVWSLRGNTVGIPTDCPQRDERLGWTGDIAVFAPTACYLFDMSAFLRAWLADLRAEQAAADGRVPYVVPDPLKGWAVREGERPESTAIWSDAAVWVPWALWESRGDLDVLTESYPSMRAHLRRVLARLSPRGVWEGDFQFGDWLDPTAPPDDPTAAIASPDVIATAALHRSLVLAGRTAWLVGESSDAREWEARAARLRDDFAAAYLQPDGTITSDAPAVYALSIVAEILSPAATERAGARLVALVRQAGHRIIAGFAGAPYLCEALTRVGALDDAYGLLMNRASPSWLHPVELGATTVWERWDSLRDDGSLNPGEMTSFNHYALGAVADWMHRTLIGIVPLSPGYARVRLHPQPGGGLPWAQGALETPQGLVAVRWEMRAAEGGAEACHVVYCAPDSVDVELGGAAVHGRRVPESAMRALLQDVPQRAD